MSRWEIFPISEQEQRYLAATTTTTPNPVTLPVIRQSLGGLLRQEISESGQTICFYRMHSADAAIPYMCELGCCNHGCCTVSDIAARSTSFGWAIALLVMVLIAIVFAVLALLSVWLMNKHKDKIHRQQLQESSTENSSISGPTSFYPEAYFQPNISGYNKPY